MGKEGLLTEGREENEEEENHEIYQIHEKEEGGGSATKRHEKARKGKLSSEGVRVLGETVNR